MRNIIHQFEDWASREVEIWTGSMKGGMAALEAAVPVIAVIVGMMAFEVIVHFAAR